MMIIRLPQMEGVCIASIGKYSRELQFKGTFGISFHPLNSRLHVCEQHNYRLLVIKPDLHDLP